MGITNACKKEAPCSMRKWIAWNRPAVSARHGIAARPEYIAEQRLRNAKLRAYLDTLPILRTKLKDGRPIVEQRTKFRFSTMPPVHVGDLAQIEVGDIRFESAKATKTHVAHICTHYPEIVIVVLLQAEDESFWLVKVD